MVTLGQGRLNWLPYMTSPVNPEAWSRLAAAGLNRVSGHARGVGAI